MNATPTLAPVDTLLRVRGTVQGVGFRPFVHRVALRLGLLGWVRNDAEGVLIRAAGEPSQIDALVAALAAEAPSAAHVTAIERVPVDHDEQPAGAQFTISQSALLTGP